nr:hypothetical protein GCM10020093_026290 [Planobispora longispora]
MLDLGCLGPRGFRGWSGGARSEYTLTPGWATPATCPASPSPACGTSCSACTGSRPRACRTGCGSSRTCPRPPSPAAPARPASPSPPREPAATRRGLPSLGGLRWLAGDLHAHTVHSDGSLTVAELACLAADRGLDFLAVTDHNTVSHHAELPAAAAYAAISLLPGQEITTDLGHANAFGDLGWIDFREPPGVWAAAVRERGGVMSINHPVAADCAWRHPTLGTDVRSPVVETWHWSWLDRSWGAPLAWTQAWTAAPIMIGGSDYHRPEEGHPGRADHLDPRRRHPRRDPRRDPRRGHLRLRRARRAAPAAPRRRLPRPGRRRPPAVGPRHPPGDRRRPGRPARPAGPPLETFRNEVMALCS